MHELPDTDDQDQERERYWPERYKRFLREEFALTLKERLNGGLSLVWQERFAARYPDYAGFLARLADMLIVGAENGADDAFDSVYSAFVLEAPLPQPRGLRPAPIPPVPQTGRLYRAALLGVPVRRQLRRAGQSRRFLPAAVWRDARSAALVGWSLTRPTQRAGIPLARRWR